MHIGKTNTMLHLASLLWRDENIPFLAFEPAKKEYRALFNDPAMKGVLLFSPRLGTGFPLRVNPFEFPVGLTLSEHMNVLMEVFAGSFEVSHSMPFFLDKAIEEAYECYDWTADRVNDGTLEYPTLETVYPIFQKIIEESDFEGDIRGNYKAFLQSRLGSLMKRDAGQLFNVSKSTLRPHEWLLVPAIIELESLGAQEKNFLILLLCSLIRESLRVDPRGAKDMPVRHAIFIEEAHNIIADRTMQGSAEYVNPQVSATIAIVKMLAEVRALKEAIFIADQIPSTLAIEVTKNTGLKIAHRLTSKDDREMLGAVMSASAMQQEALATYETGEALLFYEGLQKPFKARIAQWGFAGASEGDRYAPMDDETLLGYFKREDTSMGALLQEELIYSLDRIEEEAVTLHLRYGQLEDMANKLGELFSTIEEQMEEGPKIHREMIVARRTAADLLRRLTEILQNLDDESIASKYKWAKKMLKDIVE
jgi:hypothetical protein